MTSKKYIYYILAGFVAGTLLLIFIQYNTSKNIGNLITGNEKLLNEFRVSNELKDLEKNIFSIESQLRGAVNAKNLENITELERKIREIETVLDQLQKISDDDNSVKLIDELDGLVRELLRFDHQVVDSFAAGGKPAAEKLLATQRAMIITTAISAKIQTIDQTRKGLLENVIISVDKSGTRALRFSTILIAIVLISSGILFWYIIHIIRNQIQLIKDLNLSEKKVIAAARVKENFMANMSHEIRTPLNAILGFTNLLQKEALTGKTKNYVDTIHNSGENLLTIVNDILDFSKIEAGMVRIESAPFSIRSLLASVTTLFSTKVLEKQLELRTQVDEQLPDILEGDATRLTQILVNLISNALKFTEKGLITIDISGTTINDDKVDTIITITDTGIGIPTEKILSIFDRFEQADDAITRKFGGTGLGLSIVKDLVLLQQGTITAESEPGKGTSFILHIPYKISTADLSMDIPGEIQPDEPEFSTHITILVAEDNEINQSLLSHIFNNWKLAFDLVKNGKEAIALLESTPDKYDLVLMDIQMPEMDGYTATRQIRSQLHSSIPIIAMTAHVLAGEKEKCLAAGMNGYIAKPLQELTLKKIITSFTKHSKDPYQYLELSYMKSVSGGNTDYEKSVTAQFLEILPADLIALEIAWSAQDLSRVKQLAHDLKTTTSVMGLNQVLDPYLDTLEYNPQSAESFRDIMEKIKSISDIALHEARQFYES